MEHIKTVSFCPNRYILIQNYFMKFNLNQAAKAVNIARSTLYRDINNGKVSIVKDPKGKSFIDVSELERVYGKVKLNETEESVSEIQSATIDNTRLYEQEISLLREHINLLKDERDDLRKRLDDESSERKKLTLLLTHQTKEAEDKYKAKKTGKLWDKIFKKRH